MPAWLRYIGQVEPELSVVTHRNGNDIAVFAGRKLAGAPKLFDHCRQLFVCHLQWVEVNEKRRISRVQITNARIRPGLERMKQGNHPLIKRE